MKPRLKDHLEMLDCPILRHLDVYCKTNEDMQTEIKVFVLDVQLRHTGS